MVLHPEYQSWGSKIRCRLQEVGVGVAYRKLEVAAGVAYRKAEQRAEEAAVGQGFEVCRTGFLAEGKAQVSSEGIDACCHIALR